MATAPHADVQALLEQMDQLGIPSFSSLSVGGARALLEEVFAPDADPESVGNVRDLRIQGPESEIPLRVYTPSGDPPFPGLVWYHGGGWVLGNLDSVDPACRALTNATDHVVVSVDYRLAPEHPFPAAPRDCYAATQWVADHTDTLHVSDSLAVGGSSAGGNLAAAVTLMANHRTGPAIDYQVLVYPVTNYESAYTESMPSYTENAEGYFLTLEDMHWFIENYLPSDIAGYHPYAFPLHARDLSGLPPATVITAGFDPLRDEGIEYAERLDAAGVPVEHRHWDDMIHGFFSLLVDPELDQAHEAVGDVAADLARYA